MIRFSAALVAVAVGVLVAGVVTSKLLFVYVAIGVSAAALIALAIGVVLRRAELFGEPGASPGPAVAGASAEEPPLPSQNQVLPNGRGDSPDAPRPAGGSAAFPLGQFPPDAGNSRDAVRAAAQGSQQGGQGTPGFGPPGYGQPQPAFGQPGHSGQPQPALRPGGAGRAIRQGDPARSAPAGLRPGRVRPRLPRLPRLPGRPARQGGTARPRDAGQGAGRQRRLGRQERPCTGHPGLGPSGTGESFPLGNPGAGQCSTGSLFLGCPRSASRGLERPGLGCSAAGSPELAAAAAAGHPSPGCPAARCPATGGPARAPRARGPRRGRGPLRRPVPVPRPLGPEHLASPGRPALPGVRVGRRRAARPAVFAGPVTGRPPVPLVRRAVQLFTAARRPAGPPRPRPPGRRRIPPGNAELVRPSGAPPPRHRRGPPRQGHPDLRRCGCTP